PSKAPRRTLICVVLGVAAEQVRSAFAAEALLKAAVCVAPDLHELPALEQSQRAAVDPRLSRGGRARAALAASAMAVAGSGRRLGELEAHAAAQTASGERRLAHARSMAP